MTIVNFLTNRIYRALMGEPVGVEVVGEDVGVEVVGEEVGAAVGLHVLISHSGLIEQHV